MKLSIYRILYVVGLSISLIFSLVSSIFMIYSIANGLNESSDNVILILCFLVLLVFTIFQIYAVVRSMKEGSVFFRGIIENLQKQLNTTLLIILNVLLTFIVAFFIYVICLACGIEMFLSQFPLVYDMLILSFLYLAITNIVFFDLYTLVYKQEK